MQKLYEALREELTAGRDAVVCTILSSSGSTPRGTGAWMLVRTDGGTTGTIGGGAVEYEATRRARELLASGVSRRQRYALTNAQAADLGMICGGEVEVYFQYFDSARGPEDLSVLRQAADLAAAGKEAWLATAMDEDGWRMGIYFPGGGPPFPDVAEERLCSLAERRPRLGDGSPCLLLQPLCPEGTVYLFGGGHVGRALAHLLALTDFRTVVYDQRREAVRREFFPDGAELHWGPFAGALTRLPAITAEDYVVIMTPGHQGDYEILSQALRTPARYIGCIGSRKKVAVTRQRLLADGFGESDIRRVHAPIGLDIGGETPAEVAVSVAAQLIACRWGRPTRREERS